MKKGISLWIGCALAASLPGSIWAAMPADMAGHPAPVYELKAVTVTANRQAEDIQKVPANVSIITGSQIKERNIQSAADAVALASGVFVDQNNEGAEVHMRGYDSKSILVLVDGQEMNSAYNGEVYWGTLPVDNISRIEVVKGGQSAMYGGNAVGGVINIITNTTRHDGVYGTILGGYGTNGTVRQVYNVRGKEGKVTFGVNYESRSTDGWVGEAVTGTATDLKKGQTTKDSVEKYHLQQTSDGKYILGTRGRQSVMSETYGAQVGYHFNEDRSVNYKYTHGNYSWKYGPADMYIPVQSGYLSAPGNKKVSMTPSIGTFGFRNYDMHSLTYNDQASLFHAHVGLTKYTKDGYTSATASRFDKWENGTYEGPGNRYDYPSQLVNFDMNKRWVFGDHTFLAGMAYSQGKFDETVYKIDDWHNIHASGTRSDWYGGKVQSYAFYGQDKWQFTDRWTAYAGLRYDHFKKYDGYAKQVTEDYKDDSSSQVSPKLSLEYAQNDSTTYYASYGRSFNPPQMYQLYRTGENQSTHSFIQGNPSLDPESTDNWEVGLKKKLGTDTNLQMDFFYAKTKDYIQLVETVDKTDAGYPIKHYVNSGDATTKGVELSLNHSYSDKWSSYVDWTWQTGDIAANTATAGETRIPKHIFRTGVTYTNNPWTVSLDGTFVSNRNRDPDAVTGVFGSYDPYFLLNLDSNYKFSRNLSLQLSVYNLLDRHFYDDELAEGRAYNMAVRYTF